MLIHRPQTLTCMLSDLDRSNISNAYVSGMKEELNMQGNAFNVGVLTLVLDGVIQLLLYR